jgi:DNA-binding winged helix-turn-helix (wHTH) protein/class 3 adenylate cyclase
MVCQPPAGQEATVRPARQRQASAARGMHSRSPEEAPLLYRFGACTFDPARRELRRAGAVVPLEPKGFAVLRYLLDHRDRVVSRDELLAQCWPDTFVSDAALTRCLGKIRQAVGQSRTEPPVIQTLHRQGYRFVAAVTVMPTSPEASPASAPACGSATEPSDQPAGPALAPEAAEPARRQGAPAASASGASEAPPVHPVMVAERRQVTVLSCGVVEADALLTHLSPEDLYTVMRRIHALCQTCLERLGGSLAARTEHGVLAYFGYPLAHEDDAVRAVRAGLDVVTAAAALSCDDVPRPVEQVTVRVGIHTGLMITAPLATEALAVSSAMGATSTIATAVQAQAAANTVEISEATAQLVQGYFELKALVPAQPEASAPPRTVYRVLGPSPTQTRLKVAARQGLTPFVGRTAELLLVQERWEQVQAGEGQVVLISGEAGIGKSRLVRQVAKRLAGEACTVLESRGAPDAQHTAFAPVRELMQQIVGCDADAVAGDSVARLEACCQQYALKTQAHLPFLAALLNLALPADRYSPLHLTPQQHRRRTLETLATLPVALANRRPLLLILDDVHWVDPSTLEWLDLLLDQVPSSRILVVLTCRPAFQATWPMRSYLTQVTLGRLTPLHSTKMVTHSGTRCRGRW